MTNETVNKKAFGVADLVTPWVERGELAGAVLAVGDREGLLSLECVGWADVAKKRPMTADALFWIASVTKTVTAASFMTLVDEGKVGLDEPIEKYLPEFKGMWVTVEDSPERRVQKPAKRGPTFREALSHTAGFPSVSPMQPTTDHLEFPDVLKSYTMMPLLHEPGTGYRYHQVGFFICARVAEILTGLPYDRFLEERILKPLKMVDTTYWPSEEQMGRLAKVHKPGADGVSLVESEIYIFKQPVSDRRRTATPSGGLFSTAGDMERFFRMLMLGGEIEGRRVLSEAAVKEMTRRQTAPELAEVYGLGCQPGGTWFGHGGMASNSSIVDTRLGITMGYFVQHFGFPGNGLASRDVFFAGARGRYEGGGDGGGSVVVEGVRDVPQTARENR
jgi:CubicO group peptidase (beta-lactamase class C family)